MPKQKTRNIVLFFVLVVAILPFLVIASFLFYKKRAVTQELIQSYARQKKYAFNQSLTNAGIQLQKNAHIFSQTNEVQSFFEQYNNDTTSLSAAVTKFDRFRKQSVQQAGRQNQLNDYHIQLFVPPAKNIYKSWGKSPSDDVSLLRKSIVSVNAFQSPTWALELGKSGLMLRGIAPVHSSSGFLFAGTVELFTSLQDIIKSLTNKGEHWAVYMLDKQYRLIWQNNRENSADFHRVGRFVFLQGEAYKFDSGMLNEHEFEHLMSAKEEYISTKRINDKWNIAFPLYDFSKKKIALVVLQSSKTAVEEVVPQFLEASLGVAILFLFLTYGLLARFLTHKLTIRKMEFEVPRFFLFFTEFRRLRNQLWRDQAAFRELNQAVDVFTQEKQMIALPTTNPMHKHWSRLEQVLTNEKESRQKLNEELNKKDWITNASRELDSVLHRDYDDLKSLLNEILKVYISKLGCVAGAIYLVDEQNETLTRHVTYVGKYYFGAEEKVLFGEGIIGACALEQKRIEITDVPPRYFEVASGLGQAIPERIIVEPLVSRKKLYGIVELAAMTAINKKALDFLSISTEQVAVRISIFLNSRRAYKYLKQTEDKNNTLTQTVQELSALQEEHQVVNEKFEALQNRYNYMEQMLWDSVLYVVYDAKGRIIRVNDRWLELVNLPKSHVLRGNFYDGIDFDNLEYKIQNKLWESLADGKPRRRIKCYTFAGTAVNLNEVFQAILVNNTVEQVIRIALIV